MLNLKKQAFNRKNLAFKLLYFIILLKEKLIVVYFTPFNNALHERHKNDQLIPSSRPNHTTCVGCRYDRKNHQRRQQRRTKKQLLKSVLGNVFFWEPILWVYQAPSGEAMWQAENTELLRTCAGAGMRKCVFGFVCVCAFGRSSYPQLCFCRPQQINRDRSEWFKFTQHLSITLQPSAVFTFTPWPPFIYK